MEKALGLGLLFAGGALTLKAMADKKRKEQLSQLSRRFDQQDLDFLAQEQMRTAFRNRVKGKDLSAEEMLVGFQNIRSPGSFNIEWANQENQIVGQWLLTTPQGGAVLKQAQSPTQLEELVRIAHVTDPIPNLEPEGDYNVTFDDLWNTVMGV